MKDAFHVVLVGNYKRVLLESLRPQLSNLPIDQRIALLEDVIDCRTFDQAAKLMSDVNIYPVNLSASPVPLCMLFDKYSVMMVTEYIDSFEKNATMFDFSFLNTILKTLGPSLGVCSSSIMFNFDVDHLPESLYPDWVEGRSILWRKIVIKLGRPLPFYEFKNVLSGLISEYRNEDEEE